jgi:carbonic anhydrase
MENIDKSYYKLIEGNKLFSQAAKLTDPEYFKKLSIGQTPDYLWIGCSDSRVPANEITSTKSGEIFVHRNVANLVIHTDMNLLSVMEFAVNFLKIKHIIVCGHYGCGGVKAAMSNNLHGFVDNWLCNIKDVYNKHNEELNAIADPDKREDRLVELNVIEQVRNVAKTTIVQQAWKHRPLQIHGWVYGVNNGLITDLCVIHKEQRDIEPIYKFNI